MEREGKQEHCPKVRTALQKSMLPDTVLGTIYTLETSHRSLSTYSGPPLPHPPNACIPTLCFQIKATDADGSSSRSGRLRISGFVRALTLYPFLDIEYYLCKAHLLNFFLGGGGWCTVPGSTAVPGRCAEWMEQVPIPSPSSKKPFNIMSSDRGPIRY